MSLDIEKVREFHRAVGMAVGEKPLDNIKNAEEVDYRIRLIREEFEEFVQAATGNEALVMVEQPIKPGRRDPNIVEMAGELIDLLYVVLGAAVAFNIDVDPVFDAIHEANMRKRHDDGAFHMTPTGKIIKPEGWNPANVQAALGYDAYGRTR